MLFVAFAVAGGEAGGEAGDAAEAAPCQHREVLDLRDTAEPCPKDTESRGSDLSMRACIILRIVISTLK